MPSVVRSSLCAVVAALFLCPCRTFAEDDFARSISDGTKGAIIVGVAAAYLSSKDDGLERAARMADAAVLSSAVAEYLKPVLVVNSGGRFPSGHTAASFAAATCLADIDPDRKWLYYLGAALVGWSRVQLGAHEWEDVVAGAALGISIGRWSLSNKRGLLLERVFNF